MTMPTINRNGSSAESLTRKYGAARIAVMNALDALSEAAPHGRDYQLNPGAYMVAAIEHERRYKALRDIRDEMEKLELYCFDQS